MLQPLGVGQDHQNVKHRTIWVLGFPGINLRFRFIVIFRISFNRFRSYSASLSSKIETPTYRTSGNKGVSGTIYLLSKISPRSRSVLTLALPLFFPLLPRTPKSQPIFIYMLPSLGPLLSKDQVSMLCSSTAFSIFHIMIAYTSFFPTGESSVKGGAMSMTPW